MPSRLFRRTIRGYKISKSSSQKKKEKLIKQKKLTTLKILEMKTGILGWQIELNYIKTGRREG